MLSEEKIGVILAGGESRRFGEPKAFSLFKEKPMYQWALESIEPLVVETMIISQIDLVDRFKKECSAAIYMDVEKYRGNGPLAGIYTAMVKRSAAWYYLAPCDTPCITTEVFHILEDHVKKNHVQGAVPMYNGRLHPLVSIFHRNLLLSLEELLSKGLLRMTDFIDSNPILKIEMNDYLPDNPFENINTKMELQRIEQSTNG